MAARVTNDHSALVGNAGRGILGIFQEKEMRADVKHGLLLQADAATGALDNINRMFPGPKQADFDANNKLASARINEIIEANTVSAKTTEPKATVDNALRTSEIVEVNAGPYRPTPKTPGGSTPGPV